MRIWATRCSNTQLQPPLERIYNPGVGPEDVMEVDLVGELPASNGSTQILTACDVFQRYIFGGPLRQVSASWVVHALPQISTQHAYVPRHRPFDKRAAIAPQVLTELMSRCGSKTNHATIKQAQTTGMIEWIHQKLKQFWRLV